MVWWYCPIFITRRNSRQNKSPNFIMYAIVSNTYRLVLSRIYHSCVELVIVGNGSVQHECCFKFIAWLTSLSPGRSRPSGAIRLTRSVSGKKAHVLSWHGVRGDCDTRRLHMAITWRYGNADCDCPLFKLYLAFDKMIILSYNIQ